MSAITATFADMVSARKAALALQMAGVDPEAIRLEAQALPAAERPGTGSQTSSGIFLGGVAGTFLGGLVAVALRTDSVGLVLAGMAFGALGLAMVGAFLTAAMGGGPNLRDFALMGATLRVQADDGDTVERILTAHQPMGLQRDA